jgi:antitoxin ParD1/3/4
MPKTSISISDHFDSFIAAQIAEGRYDTVSEVIRASLRFLEERETEYKTKLETLRTALIAGEASGGSNLSINDIIAAEKQKRQAVRAGI